MPLAHSFAANALHLRLRALAAKERASWTRAACPRHAALPVCRPARAIPPAATGAAGPAPRPGSGLPESDGAGSAEPLPDRPGAGRRRGALAGRRTDVRLPRATGREDLALAETAWRGNEECRGAVASHGGFSILLA